MGARYIPRLVDEQLRKRLDCSGAVLVEGPKWCGKTWTSEKCAKSALFMQDPDKAHAYALMADTKPSLLLEGSTPRLLDEWQTAPVLWDAVRFAVDRRGLPGQFILTGSAVPADDAVMHTGTGRISRLRMRTMSLFESGDSNGSVSLSDLFAQTSDITGLSTVSIEDIASLIVRGGWPATIDKDIAVAQQNVSDYVEAVIHLDVSRVDGIRRDPNRVRALMRSLARNVSTLASVPTICTDMSMGEGNSDLSAKSVRQYMAALSRIFVTEDLPGWNPVLRSKTAIRTFPKREFTDPSVAAAVLKLGSEALLSDFEYFGFLFEALCIRDLRVHVEALDGDVFHYRDKTGLEADVVIALHDGRWGAAEVKLGLRQVDEAAAHLLELRRRIDVQRMREPSFLMVLTGGEYAFRRADGVYVVPLGCLRN